MSAQATVRITGHFERNLEAVERRFLLEAEAHGAFDALLDGLADEVVPTLECHPAIGRDFLTKSADSAEAETRIERLTARLAATGEQASIREYVMAHYLGPIRPCRRYGVPAGNPPPSPTLVRSRCTFAGSLSERLATR